MSGDSGAADAGQRDLRGVLPAGTQLRVYVLLSVLGQGSFGITYRARDTQLDRDVAIKEYLPTALALREDGTSVVPRSTEHADDFVWGRDRFLDEARTLAKLSHAPAIVRVHDFLEANGTAYMVMTLAEGETLESRLEREGPLPAAAIEKILHPLLDGLEQVHEAGFLHRDIKPANIVLDARGTPTLIDFGASRAAMAGRTATMTAVFTPGYAAAEQFTSAKQGPWTDIYGLSATLYHALTGKAPPNALERSLDIDEYVSLATRPPAGVAPGLVAGIDAGLAVRASARPQSIAAWHPLLKQARDAMAGDTVVKPRPIPVVPPMASTSAPAQPAIASTTAPAGRKSAMRPMLLAGVAAVLLLSGGGFYAVISSSHQAQQERQRAEDEVRHKAEVAAQQKQAEEEAQRRAAADAEARRQADAALARAQAEQQRAQQESARLKAEMEARQRADAEAAARAKAQEEAANRANAEALAKQKSDAEAKQRAEEDAKRAAALDSERAEAAEMALGLSANDRSRLQHALTSLGFDTRGADGTFGPRSRDMIAGWQKAHSQPSTGFLTRPQIDSLLKETSAASSRTKIEPNKPEIAEKRGSNCYDSTEIGVVRIRMLQQELVVGTLQCQLPGGGRVFDGEYTKFLSKFAGELGTSGQLLQTLARRKGFNLDVLVTEIANRTARRMTTESCARIKSTFDFALSPGTTSLMQVQPPFDLGPEMNITACSR